MIKEVNFVKIEYMFDPNHKGAHYSFDGIRFMNNGEFIEGVRKSVLGLSAKKDANTSYEKGSDIPERNESVKSGKATLVNKVLGENMEETLEQYFKTVASTSFSWNFILDNNLVSYVMNASEFREFIKAWARFDAGRKVIRFKDTTADLITWLNAKAGEGL